MSTIGKRVTFVLSEAAHAQLTDMSTKHRRSMTELIRIGLGLVKIVLEGHEAGRRFVVVDADGKPEKEIVLPS